MKRIIFLFSLLLLAACSPGVAESPASVCESKGFTMPENEGCQFIQEASTSQPAINIQYPINTVLRSDLIESTLDSHIAEYRARLAADFEVASNPENWAGELRWAVYPHSDNVLSVHLTEFLSMGDTSSLRFDTYTFDIANNQVLAFEDLFTEGGDPLALLTPLARDGIFRNTFGTSVPEQYEPGTDEMSDFDDFALTDSELILFFEPGDVAAVYSGPEEIRIPLSELAEVMRDLP